MSFPFLTILRASFLKEGETMNSLNPIADLPMGLGMALAQNVTAMERFAELSPDEQRQIIDQTHTINSKSEMQSFVQNLTGRWSL